MIHINISRTQELDNGLRLDPVHGVLWAPVARMKIDPANIRQHFTQANLDEKREQLKSARAQNLGWLNSGFIEAIKCRWEPGAVLASGNIRKNAKLLVMDGGLKFRAVKEEYDWLPVTISDMSAGQAQQAALRTSLHTLGHSPVEQGKALVEEMKRDGLSLQAAARRYSVHKSVVENRVNLVLKCPEDVQQFVAAHPDHEIMSHALAVRNVVDKEQRQFLLQLAVHGASVKEIEGEIQRAAEEHQLKLASQHAPDTETQQRQTAHASTGGGQMSRGRQVTGTSKREATEAAQSAATSAAHNLTSVEQWVEQGGAVPKATLMETRRRIDALLKIA
jgi:ParB-like chromosome segregation protein Spo0J